LNSLSTSALRSATFRPLEQLAGAHKLWSKLRSAPSFNPSIRPVPPAAAAARVHFAKAVLDASNRRPAISPQERSRRAASRNSRRLSASRVR
jgi:hypothetical protein